ncbi:hypothetical protein ACFYOT_14860 [Saccharothrix saharensis]|uniref:hypothetical protein n=1 Tax=Saccharothrix saharensis TaxID=571190 RepID=UPI003690FE47
MAALGVVGPGASESVNMVIVMITSRYTSNSINERAGRFLAENQRYNVWYQLNKRKSTGQQDLELADASARLLQRCWAAWTEYLAAWDVRRPEADVYRTLIATLDEVAERYRRLCS